MRARSELDLRVPKRVSALLDAAIRAARKQAGRWIPGGEALARVARHFSDTWEEAVKERNTARNRVMARDRGFCQVPGCSRAGGHLHHVIPRSAGGGDDPENTVAICPPHHLHGIHRGYIRVRGRAPDHLEWQLGVRPRA
jgi:5-methylcytosine-specific restriction endonuclease McrA